MAAAQDYYDVLVIGADLGALLEALAAHDRGLRVGVILNGTEAGGLARGHRSAGGDLIPRFPRLFRSHEALLEPLKAWRQTGTAPDWRRDQLRLQTLDSGELRPFVGFGKNQPPFPEIWSEWTGGEHVLFSQPMEAWTAQLVEKMRGQGLILEPSTVTGWEVSEDNLQRVQLNGRHWVQAARWLVFEPQRRVALGPLGTHLPARVRQKWSKALRQGVVSLVVEGGGQPDHAGLYVLQSSGEDLSPCLGWVGTKDAVWVGVVPGEEAEDYDRVYQEIKKIKRLAKRALPTCWPETAKEHVIMEAEAVGWPAETPAEPQVVGSLRNVTFHCPDFWAAGPMEQALLTAAQSHCPPAPSVLVPSEL